MSKSWQRFDKCASSPIYAALYEAAVELLTGPGRGAFSKKQVMELARIGETQLELADVLDDTDIRWDYLVRMIEERENTSLIPMAAQFFKRHDADRPEERVPTRYMACGHGKKAVGYCAAFRRNEHFVRASLSLRRGRATGEIEKHNDVADKAARVGVQVPPRLTPPQPIVDPDRSGPRLLPSE